MRSLLTALSFALVLLVSVPAFADRDHDRGGHRLARLQEEAAQISAQLRDELRSLDDLVEAADSAGVRREIHRKVDRIAELLEASVRTTEDIAALARDGRRSDEVVVVVQPPPEVYVDPGPMACAGSDFDNIVRSVEGESFSDGKLQVLRDASRDRWFEVAQVKRLIGLFTFGKDQVQAGKMLHSRTIDLANWYQVYDVFTFDSDKRALREAVGG